MRHRASVALVAKRRRLCRRIVIEALLCVVFGALLAGSALADSGETWLNWVNEPKGAGIHGKLYFHLTQSAAAVQSSGNVACTNMWFGTQGGWEFKYDTCVAAPNQAYTTRLADPGIQAYPWAQSQSTSDYLWGWARYY